SLTGGKWSVGEVTDGSAGASPSLLGQAPRRCGPHFWAGAGFCGGADSLSSLEYSTRAAPRPTLMMPSNSRGCGTFGSKFNAAPDDGDEEIGHADAQDRQQPRRWLAAQFAAAVEDERDVGAPGQPRQRDEQQPRVAAGEALGQRRRQRRGVAFGLGDLLGVQ